MDFNFFEKLKSDKKNFNAFKEKNITVNLVAIKGGLNGNSDESMLYCKQPCGAQFKSAPKSNERAITSISK